MWESKIAPITTVACSQTVPNNTHQTTSTLQIPLTDGRIYTVTVTVNTIKHSRIHEVLPWEARPPKN
jgi:hypothetical protein